MWANVSKVKSILDWSKAMFFYKCFIFENIKEGKKMYHQFHRSSLASVWVLHQGLSGHQFLYILSMSRFPCICSVIIAIWWVRQSTTCQVFRVGNTFPLKQKHTGRPWCGLWAQMFVSIKTAYLRPNYILLKIRCWLSNVKTDFKNSPTIQWTLLGTKVKKWVEDGIFEKHDLSLTP